MVWPSESLMKQPLAQYRQSIDLARFVAAFGVVCAHANTTPLDWIRASGARIVLDAGYIAGGAVNEPRRKSLSLGCAIRGVGFRWVLAPAVAPCQFAKAWASVLWHTPCASIFHVSGLQAAGRRGKLRAERFCGLWPFFGGNSRVVHAPFRQTDGLTSQSWPHALRCAMDFV